MKNTLVVIPARARHIRPIARNMRKADRDEVAASTGKTPAAALAMSLRRSKRAYTIMLGEKPIGLFGVGDVNILAGVGAPWLLGTDDIERHAASFLRQSIYWRGQLSHGYFILRNAVDDRNKLSMRWLSWLGFQIGEPVDFRGHRFRIFEMRFG